MKRNKGGNVWSVQVITDDGGVMEHTEQDAVQKAIWDEIHGKRFYLAEQAPICQERLREEFGYMANTPAAEQVLDGTYQVAGDKHMGTLELFDEIARIRSQIPKNLVNCLVRHTV